MTACYWIWKNDVESDYVGICHYRRYFVGNDGKLISAKEIERYLSEDYDVILPTPICWTSGTCMECYMRGAGYKKDYNHCRNIISENSPDYLSAFDAVMNGSSASYANMFICSKEIYDAYCEWLFGILFALEKVTDLTGYTQQEKRIYGYLSELLLNVFCRKNDFKIKCFDVKLLMEPNDVKNQRRLKAMQMLKRIVKRIIWFPSGIKPASRRE